MKHILGKRPTADTCNVYGNVGSQTKLRIFCIKPRKNEKYVLNLDGKLIDGTTDGDGEFEHFIPGDSRSALLMLRNGQEVIPLRLGDLDPCDQATGIQQRLNNLGFDCGSEDGEIGDASKEAIKTFQEAYKLDVTGEADDATKNKLKELCK